MEEGSKVRLVRCPKCDNLLQEVPNVPIYQCGGCSAVLQVQMKSTAIDGSMEKLYEEKVKLGSEKSESDREIDGVEIRERGENLNSSSSSRIGNRDVREGKTMGNWGPDRGRMVEQESDFGGNFRRPSKAPVDYYSSEDDQKVSNRKGVRQTIPQIGIMNSSERSDQIPNFRVPERDGMMGYRRGRRTVSEAARFSNSPYPDEGPSNHQPSSSNYGYGEPIKKQISLGVPERIEYLEQDRAELLRQLEELKSKLSRTGEPKEQVPVGERMVHQDPYYGVSRENWLTESSSGSGRPPVRPSLPKEQVPVGERMVHQDPYYGVSHENWLTESPSGSGRASVRPSLPKEQVPVGERMVHQDPYYGVSHENRLTESPSGSGRAPVRPSLPDNNVRMLPSFNRSHDHVPVMNVNDMDLQNFYHPMHKPNEILGYGDPLAPQIHRRAPNQLPHRYSQPPSHDYYSREYMGMDPDPVLSYPNNSFFHHPTCSCFQCYNKQWQGSKQASAAVLGDRRFRDAPTDRMFYHVENPGAVGPRGYHPGGANLNPSPLHARVPLSLSQRSNDLDSGLGGFSLGRLEEEAQTKRHPHRCTPTAGGAPFIACYSCFELLQLPRKFLLMKNNKRKLKCGACSTVMLILIESKKLLVSVPSEIKEIPLEVNGGSVEVIKEGPLHSNGHTKRYSVNSYNDDYGNSGYSYLSVDSDNTLSAIDQRLNLRDSEKMQETPSSPSCATDNEESPDSVIAQRALPKPADLPVKENITPPVPGSPLLEHFEYSSYQRQVTESEKGNESKRMDQEVVLTTAPSKQNSVATAIEIEVPFDYTNNTGISQYSEEVSKEDDETDILINGYPISGRLIMKAEKRAGKIHPGQYWYDFRAGFWGVMGQPCMGVIPSKIEEFNYPMSKDCAGGNTGVCVNGRELHQKDLNLLAGRGLPTTRNKSYTIEISGSVRDDDDGEELDGLGKLAPTIEKLKHGFGMRSPRIAA